jgi:hypothetical protein
MAALRRSFVQTLETVEVKGEQVLGLGEAECFKRRAIPRRRVIHQHAWRIADAFDEESGFLGDGKTIGPAQHRHAAPAQPGFGGFYQIAHRRIAVRILCPWAGFPTA